ncbi:excalibur calcium-binding domain-containing protein [Streptococcus didelphis]|uniref:Excalibur calcium-binding domain-containing protein n=2 Tax=Streptococcus didelphis TaxID=102886 RepID=A0ABY9LKM6_9STRE|nr:excalibur calcium-binding domain-containing protein [Streptococcus didelphis]WMB28710.1 excalibur calcium-binding domain-containing protein [Streptococcus didelphis]
MMLTPQKTTTDVKSKSSTKTELVSSKKSKKKRNNHSAADSALSKAESAIKDLEKNPSREGINDVRLLINRVKNDPKKQMLQDRLALIEQKVAVNEAETATKLLESNQTKENLDMAKQKIDRITDSNKKEPYLLRLNRVSEAIKVKEEQEAILANPENVLKKLENNQTRENGLEAQNVINTITDTSQRSSYQKRIDSVISAIESREAQIAAQQVQAAQSTSRRYANCTDMRNAGAAPIAQGQPGYESRLDRDHDGWACE